MWHHPGRLRRGTAALTALAVFVLALAVAGIDHRAASAAEDAAVTATDAAPADASGATTPGRCQILKCANFLPAAHLPVERPQAFGRGIYRVSAESAPHGRMSLDEPPPPRGARTIANAT